ncbi:family 4 glycosyl hydrolase [Nakamurella endophytica]|uniref:family 4 glycosyl hydrolase n=1 Tax=Nakamurella endophytica TaxID=1748367 RepID=UPI001E540D5B|nr:hypothetical protein [Nakamurella endophytica]
MRLVVLGGGGFRTPLLVEAVRRRPELGIDEIVLHDVDRGRLAVVEAVVAGTARPGPGPRVRTGTDLRDALQGAGAVFSAIRVGGAAARVADERDALRLGLLGQETVGAGGLAYAVRSLPAVLAAARTQAEVAPDAWLLMFTNPAGMTTQAARQLLGDRVVGICDSPTGLVARAARAAGVDPAAADPDYVGINHLGWLTALRSGGRDVLPELLADPARLQRFEEGRLFGAELLDALGYLPNEYLYFFYRSRELARELAAGRTRGEVLAADQAAFYAAAGGALPRAADLWRAARLQRERTYLAEGRAADEDRDEADLTGGGYQDVALDALEALTGGRPARLVLDVRNGGAVPQLPADTVVETLCDVDATGVRPRPAPPLDLHRLGLLASVRAAEDAMVHAVTHGSTADARRAFALHPLVGSWEAASPLLAGALARVDPDWPWPRPAGTAATSS